MELNSICILWTNQLKCANGNWKVMDKVEPWMS